MPIVGQVGLKRPQQRALAGIVLADDQIDTIGKFDFASIAERLEAQNSGTNKLHVSTPQWLTLVAAERGSIEKS